MPKSTASASSDALPELIALGQLLREARSRQGLSQEELAERLRLGTDQLDALEQGDRSRLPEPVFVIAQAKRVAGSLGITIDEQIAALRRSGLMEPARRPAAPALVAPEPLAAEVRAARLAAPSAAMPSWLPAAAAAVVALGLATALLLPKRQAPSRPPAAATPATTAAPTSPTSLELRPREPSWLAVQDLNGRILFEGTLSQPRSFPLGRGLEVRAGRPDEVTVSAPGLAARPLGTSDDFGWKRFSPPLSSLSAATAPPPAPRP